MLAIGTGLASLRVWSKTRRAISSSSRDAHDEPSAGKGAVRGEFMKKLIFAAALALWLVVPTGPQGRGRPPQPVYFWADLADAISGPGQIAENRPVIRPRGILLFADG